MKLSGTFRRGFVASIALFALAAACTEKRPDQVGGILPAPLRPGAPVKLSAEERLITILATNDIHGGVESTFDKNGNETGGLALFSGIVKAVRTGLDQAYGRNAGVLVLDGGDQFQGTLLSNFSEGELTYRAMNEVGYDAVVPGNHAYDFGPQGWLEDQVTATSADKDPRGALLKIAGVAKFPLLSANTYLKDSIVDEQGKPLTVAGVGCKPSSSAAKVDWTKAKRPAFLTPYVIKDVAGLRVAIVGIDHPTTPTTTTPANVSDFCFRDEAHTYAEVRAEIGSRADVFLIVIHNGDAKDEFEGSELIRELNARGTGVDAVIAGHTHFVNDVSVGEVPLIQSSANGRMFGRIDLVFNTKAGKIDTSRTRRAAGIPIWKTACPRETRDYCSEDKQNGLISYEGAFLNPDTRIHALIQEARRNIAPVAGRKLGVAEGPLRTDRIKESNLANALTDVLRAVSKAEVAFMNTGGIRAPLDAGDFTYEQFYRVLPFNNRGVLIGPMAMEKMIGLLERSIKTCAAYGALMQSGLRVEYERDCRSPSGGVDPKARLTKVTTLAGEVILDRASGIEPAAGRTFQVATLDFLHAGGSGYVEFSGVPLVQDLGIVREVMVDFFLRTPARFSAQLDERWKESPRAN